MRTHERRRESNPSNAWRSAELDLAYAVSHRTREIGIRVAMGAESRQVIGLVVREGVTMALAGAAIGTAVAWFLTDLLSGMLYQVAPQDPTTFLSVAFAFALVALRPASFRLGARAGFGRRPCCGGTEGPTGVERAG